MTFLAPHFIWVGLGISALVTALHFIVTRQPASRPFPTARFVPDVSVQAITRSTQPTDMLVLLLRLLAIMSIAAAFSRPVITPKREAVARIILVDLSNSSRALSEVRDSAANYFRPTDSIIGYDSGTRPISHPDSIATVQPSAGAGNLSTAIVAAIRAGARIRDRADSISLIAISAFPAQSWDAATDTLRSLWPGSIQIVRIAQKQSTDSTAAGSAMTGLSQDDPLAFAVTLASKGAQSPNVEIVRGSFPANRTSSQTGVLLHWPSIERPLFATRAREKEHGALITDSAVIVAPFSTIWTFSPDSIRGLSVIARWEDGTAAAVQDNGKSGCRRSTSIPVTARGDIVIRPEFVAVVKRLISPCVFMNAFTTASDAALLRLRGGTAAAPRAAFESSQSSRSPYTILFFVAAVVFLVAEQVARRTGRGRQTESSPMANEAAA